MGGNAQVSRYADTLLELQHRFCGVLVLRQQHGSYGLLGAVWETTRKFHAIPTLWSLLELQHRLNTGSEGPRRCANTPWRAAL